jgi:hypothetical protein
VQDRSQCPVVGADGHAGGERRRPDEAPRARTGRVELSPRAQRIAAATAERRREPRDRPPTIVADRSVERTLEGLVARRASRRQYRGNDGVRKIHQL